MEDSGLAKPLEDSPERVARFHQWVYCICLVEFDIEEGQVIRYQYPKGILKENEERIIADLAMQDSHGGKTGQTMSKHVFVVGDDLNSRYFGFSCQVNIPNKEIARGYEQKAVAIICKYPLMELFFYMLNVIGPRIISHGVDCAEEAIEQICSWPTPNWGFTLSLQIMGCVFRLNLPKPIPLTNSIIPEMRLYRVLEAQNFKNGDTIIEEALKNSEIYNKQMIKFRRPQFSYPNSGPNMDKFLATNSIGIIRSDANLAPLLTPANISNIWFIFLHMIIGNPIIVFGSNAQSVSGTVMGLSSLLSIMPFGADLIPYFTTYHKKCDEYFPAPTEPPHLPPCIIGMTNPYFETSIKLLECGVIVWIDTGAIEVRQPKKKQNAIVSLFKDIKQKANSKPVTIESIYEHFQPDKHIIKLLQGKSWQVACAVIKGHFQSMIDELMGPLNEWFVVPQFVGNNNTGNTSPNGAVGESESSVAESRGYDNLNNPHVSGAVAIKAFNSFNGVPISVAIDKILDLNLDDCYAPCQAPKIGPLSKENALEIARRYYENHPPYTLINVLKNNTARILQMFELFVSSVHFRYLLMLQQPMLLIAKRELFDFTLCKVITADTLINGRSKNGLKTLLQRVIEFQKKLVANPSTTERVKKHFEIVIAEVQQLFESK